MMKVWPFGVALRREASNRHLLRWLKTVVVSDVEKAHLMRQVGIRKSVRSFCPGGVGVAVDVSLAILRWRRNRGVRTTPG